MAKKNYVIYHRNNRTLQLINHFESDGDIDSNYILLRNVALTGSMINGKFVSDNKEHFKWLVECAKTELSSPYCKYQKSRCGICNGIFKDVMNDNYEITDFYMKNVVQLNQPHPLYQEILNKFNGIEIE
tara:strand:+ start:80 stop:466 length:387 start_codon:yes stop_codon:yes gene_type:complete